jgi:hypothetical protein
MLDDLTEKKPEASIDPFRPVDQSLASAKGFIKNSRECMLLDKELADANCCPK